MRTMFVSFYDALATYQQSQREGSVDRPHVIGEGQDFNIAIIKDVIANLQSAHIEFTKI